MNLHEVALLVLALFLATAGHHPASGEQRSPRVVTTKYGQLRGVIKSLLNKRLRPVEIFLGVPYAAPPVGKKRFSPTKTPTPWSGERIADQYGPVCPQHLPELWGEEAEATIPRDRLLHLRRLANYLTHQAEDCLYLNVYVPSLVADMSGHRALPVLVFIHGESFLWGASNSYDGSVIAAYSEVIVVTLNYRLGPLGFLNTNSDLSDRRHVANHGLLDQIAALHWIQENIGAFGGDPGSVTLMGHGTGAASINFLMISAAVTPGLFHRAILMSGSALSSWATVTTPLQYALQFGHALNCTGDLLPLLPSQQQQQEPQSISPRELDQMVLCLKEKPLDEIQAVNIAAPQFLHAFGPSIDGIVIKSDFRTKLRKTADDFTKEYDLLFGVVPHESYNDFNQEDLRQGISLDRRDRIFRTMIRNSYDYHLNEVFISVVNEYTYWEEPEEHPFLTRDATMSALSDGRYVAPLLVTANNLRIGDKNQYFYVFDYTPSKNDIARTVNGAVHGDELPFAMGAPLVGELGVFKGNWSRQDELLSEAFLTYITNFVKTGNPNFKPGQELNVILRDKLKFKNVDWEKYDPVYQKYLRIGIQTKPESHYRAHQMALWTWLVPEMQQVGRREFLTLLEDPEESSIPVSKEQLQELSVLHHLFLQHDSPELYSGVVRPLHHMAGHYIVPTSTTTMAPPSTNIPPRLYQLYTTHRSAQHRDYNFQPVAPMNATAHVQPTMLEGVGYVSYSTALSVTVAIGVSLLLLNALIFAGVYYRRDRRQAGDKKEQQSQHDSQSSSEQHLPGISSVFGPNLGSVSNVDIAKTFTAATPRPVPSSPLSYSPEVTHISECPPAFADIAPCEESNSQYDVPPSAIPLNVANGGAQALGGPGGGGGTPQQQYQQQKLSEEHQQQQQQQARHYMGIPPPHSVVQLGPSESQPLLPINMPSPPHKKVPPYDELRV